MNAERSKPTKGLVSSTDFVDIVHDAAIAVQGLAFGKMVPLAVLDTRSRTDIVDVVKSHGHLPPGDVRNEWAVTRAKSKRSSVYLKLEFMRPVRANMTLSFPLRKWAGFVDLVVTTGMLYIQPGEPGHGVYDAPHGRLGVEIGSKNFLPIWSDLYYKHSVREFLDRGQNRRDAKRSARLLIEQHRQLNRFQLPD